ncbi:PepSY-like domain-containing protein [Pedobacter soli]|uniref:Putative beta-lactamase-inhibitor-like, PepSY-like n=1 Tax=Pedobacter soli TaxID=390242 RepID=A0A1G6XZD0_9SPHI|nr:PepSY-like domain-containing protein [Pedobacter soli]SDD83043.1 Putative beta-lactamase-inhibitor-like, PepSY-like [Pedobacter soli]
MKRIFGILLLAGTMVTAVKAQKISAAKVPAEVQGAFAKLYPGVKANWEMEKKDYEAGFTFNGKATSVVFNAKGLLLETETAIKPGELPAPVLAKLKGSKIAEAAKIMKADGSVRYEAEVKGKDLLFDLNGNQVKP